MQTSILMAMSNIHIRHYPNFDAFHSSEKHSFACAEKTDV